MRARAAARSSSSVGTGASGSGETTLSASRVSETAPRRAVAV
nr:hypothetical protein [Rubrobacter marinus]